jgi:hypothetical protein
MRFEILLDSELGTGTVFKCEVSPSQDFPPQVCRWNSDLILYGLGGRAEIVAEDGARAVLGPSAIVRVPKGTKVLLRNELRDTFRCLGVLPQGGAETFLDSLAISSDENSMIENAAASGLELHLPTPEAEIPAAIKALEQRIQYPMTASFSL